ncbi:MAG: class I SAM-dependent methyltransferase [Myxococcota bacterium]|nr:class I SAM-dependent methyltransferase [Myxococcota bacterium]
MTDATCPICSASGAPFTSHERERERWTCFHCPQCASEYWSPRVIRPGFYEDGHEDTYERRHGGERFLRPRHRLFLARAQRGTLLDIGCGEGSFLGEAQARGFAVHGIDLDERSISVARERGLANVWATPLFDADSRTLAAPLRDLRNLDYVTAFEVLEHQADPLAFLGHTRDLLAPRGMLCGSVPNRERLFANRQRRINFGDFPPHHFLWFSAETLAHTLRTAGFTDVHVQPVPEDEVTPYAAYLEDALLGVYTKGAKAKVNARLASGKRGSKKLVKRIARAVKNVPFLPLALAVRTLAPQRQRTLYFEAHR